ncbi:hypothetical protein, partial [Xanthomonas phaseoli]
GDDLAVGKAGLLHGTSSRKDTRKFHFWRLLMGGGITPAGHIRMQLLIILTISAKPQAAAPPYAMTLLH